MLTQLTSCLNSSPVVVVVSSPSRLHRTTLERRSSHTASPLLLHAQSSLVTLTSSLQVRRKLREDWQLRGEMQQSQPSVQSVIVTATP